MEFELLKSLIIKKAKGAKGLLTEYSIKNTDQTNLDIRFRAILDCFG